MNKIITSAVDQDIAQSTSNFHDLSLHVAQLNLIDYNTRLDTDFDLVYLKDTQGGFFFQLRNPSQYLQDYKIDGEINFLKSWAVNYSYNNNDWFRDYFNHLKSEVNDLSTWRTLDRKAYDRKRNLIIKRFKNYAPLGFLSAEEMEKVKSETDNRFIMSLL